MHDVRSALVSIDDFYLPNAKQRALAADFPDNRLVQGRGVAGTHDLQLSKSTLDQMMALKCASQAMWP